MAFAIHCIKGFQRLKQPDHIFFRGMRRVPAHPRRRKKKTTDRNEEIPPPASSILLLGLLDRSSRTADFALKCKIGCPFFIHKRRNRSRCRSPPLLKS